MAREKIWFSDNDEVINPDRQLELFSVASDLKLEKKPIKMRYRTLLKDYQMYVRTKKANLKSDDVNILDQMLVLRFNNLINNVEKEVGEGKLLSMLLGVTEPDLRKACDEFSRQYRKLLQARDTLGYIPRINQSKVDDAYKLMIAELRKLIFAPVMTMFSQDPAALPEDVTLNGAPEVTEDQAKLLINEKVTPLSTLYNLIVGFLRSQNINAKLELSGDKINVSL